MVPNSGSTWAKLDILIDLQTLLLAKWERNAVRQTPRTLETQSSYPTHSYVLLRYCVIAGTQLTGMSALQSTSSFTVCCGRASPTF